MDRKEAIEIIIKNYPHVSNSGSQFESALRELIPELKESEDERIRKDIINYIGFEKPIADKDENRIKEMIAYLEKQKEQKPAEWSEEDSRIIDGIQMILELWDRRHASPNGIRSVVPEYISWLKSLRPQPHWKPGEEQMESLRCWCDATKNKLLVSLYNDLKKLM